MANCTSAPPRCQRGAGSAQAVGLSVQQLEELMRQRLADGYVLEPQLSISVEAYRNRHVYVLGAVHNPGIYPLRHEATLLELLSQAGGPIRTSHAGYVQVVRPVAQHNGARPGTTRNLYSPTALVIDVDKLLAGQVTPPIRLESGYLAQWWQPCRGCQTGEHRGRGLC